MITHSPSQPISTTFASYTPFTRNIYSPLPIFFTIYHYTSSHRATPVSPQYLSPVQPAPAYPIPTRQLHPRPITSSHLMPNPGTPPPHPPDLHSHSYPQPISGSPLSTPPPYHILNPSPPSTPFSPNLPPSFQPPCPSSPTPSPQSSQLHPLNSPLPVFPSRNLVPPTFPILSLSIPSFSTSLSLLLSTFSSPLNSPPVLTHLFTSPSLSFSTLLPHLISHHRIPFLFLASKFPPPCRACKVYTASPYKEGKGEERLCRRIEPEQG